MLSDNNPKYHEYPKQTRKSKKHLIQSSSVTNNFFVMFVRKLEKTIIGIDIILFEGIITNKKYYNSTVIFDIIFNLYVILLMKRGGNYIYRNNVKNKKRKGCENHV